MAWSALSPKAHAANATWSGATNSTWSTGTNWSATPVPGTGDTATFNSAGNGQTTLDLGAGVTVRSIQFNTSSAAAYTIGSGSVGSQTLTLDNGGNITMSSTVAANQLVNAALTLGGNGSTQTFTISNDSTSNTLTLAAPITGSTGSGTKTLAVSGAGNSTISAEIGNGAGGGSVALTKSGAGTLTLAGANTYTGATTINAGTIALAAANSLADTSPITVNASLNLAGFNETIGSLSGNASGSILLGSGTLTVDSGSNSQFNGSVSGTGGFVKTGAGTLNLRGTLSHTGLTTVSAGTLQLQGSSPTILGDVLINGGSMEDITMGGRLATTSSVTISSGSMLTLGGNVSSWNISGGTVTNAGRTVLEGGLNMTGGTLVNSGTLTLNATSTITGSGTLRFAGANTRVLVQAPLVLGNGTVDWGISTNGSNQFSPGSSMTVLNGSTFNFTNSGGAIEPAYLNLTGVNLQINVEDNANLNMGWRFGDPGATGSFTKNGNGTMTITSSNQYIVGSTTLNAGTLALAHPSDSLYGNLNINGGTLALGANNDTVGLVTLAGGNITGTGTLTGSVQNASNPAYILQGGTVGANLGTGRVSVTTGTTTLLGTSASAAVTVSSGNLTLGAAERLDNTTALTISGGTLHLGSNDETVGIFTISSGSLSGTGTLTGATYALQGGDIGANLGAGTVTVTSGSTSLSGTAAANTVNINSGTLALAGANRLADTASVSVNSTLDLGGFNETIGALSGNSSGSVILGTATLTSNTSSSSTYAGSFSGASGNFVKEGSGTLTLSGANTSFNGTATINAGALRASNANALGSTAAGTTVSAGGALELTGNIAIGQEALSITGNGISNGGALRSVSGNNSYAGAITLGGDAWIASDLNTDTLTLSGGISGNGANLTVSGFVTVSTTGISLGSGGLTKTGNGSLSIQAPGTYTGATNINDGFITLGGVAGSLPTESAITIASAGTFQIARSNNVVQGVDFGNTISGAGGLRKTGAITLTLTGSNSYSGSTAIQGGAIRAAHSNALGSSAGGTTLTSTSALELIGDISIGNEALSISGNGVSTDGALRNISGNNTYGGTITLGAASRINSDADLLTLDVASGNAVTGAFNIAFGGSGNTTVADPIATSTGTLTKDGSGRLTLSGANTYTGATSISAGALRASHANALGTTAAGTTVSDGAALEISGGTTIAAEALSLAGTGISSGGALRNISGSNTYQGAITLAAASRINSDADLLTLDVASGNAVAGTFNLTFGGSGNTTVADPIATSTGTLTKDGSGRLTLSGANTYTGATLISDGTIHASNDTALGTTAGGVTVSNGAALEISGGITMGAEALSLTGNGISSGGALRNISGNNIYQGAITLAAASRINSDADLLTLDVASGSGITGTFNLAFGGLGNTTVADPIATGTGTLTKDGTGRLTLSGANTFTGTASVNGGNLTLSGGSALADGTAVALGDTAGAVLHVASSETIGSLSGGGSTGGNISIASGTTLTVNQTSSGSFGGSTGGAGALTKNGSATLTVSGILGHGGATTINAGTLALSGANLLPTSANVTISSPGTLQIASGDQSLGSISGNGTIDLGSLTLTTGTTSSTFTGNITGVGGLTKSGAGTFTLGGNGTFFGQTNITGGTLVLNSATAIRSDSIVFLGSGATLTVNQQTVVGSFENNGGTLNGAGSLISALTLTQSGTLAAVIADGTSPIPFAAGIRKTTSGTTTIEAANTFTGLVRIEGGTLVLGTGGSFSAASSLLTDPGATMDLNGKSQTFSAVNGSGGTIALGSGSLTVNGSAASTTAASITGIGSLTKNGSSTLTLSAGSSYSGTTAINAGAIRAGHANALGDAASGTTVANGAALELIGGITTGAEALTLSGNGISSDGALRSISGNNTYQGAITLAATSRINSDADLLTLDVASGNGITGSFNLAFGGSGNTTVADPIATSTGTLTKDGTGRLTLSGANTYTGATSIGAGALRATDSAALGTTAGGATVSSGAALELSGGITIGAEALSLSGTGISSDGALRNISGSNIYQGAITLAAASRINSDADLLTLDVASGSGITGTFNLTFGGSGNTTVADPIATSTGTLTKDGTGRLTLSGANTYTGATSIGAGALRATNSAALGTTAGGATVSSGAALELSGGITIGAEALSLSGTGISSDGALRNISGNNIYQGAITLAAASRINSDADLLTLDVASGSGITGTFNLAFGGSGNTTVADPIATSTGTLTKDGTGRLTLSGANTYTGATSIGAGTIRATNGTALGTTAGGVTVSNGAALELSGGITIGAEALSLTGSGISSGGALRNISGNNIYQGAITLAAASRINSDADLLTLDVASGSAVTGSFNITFGGSGNTTVADPIAIGSGTLAKDGGGTLTLSAANTYIGATVIDSGIVRATNNTALGTTAGGVTVSSGAALELSGGITIGAEVLNLSGSGISSGGALRNIANNNNYQGGIILSAASRIASDSGTLTLSGGISGAQNVTFSGSGSITVSSTIGTSSGTLTKDGSGTLTLSGTNSYTGATTINLGTLALGASNVINDSSTVALNGGVFDLGVRDETIHSLAMSGGTLNRGAGNLTLSNASSITGGSVVISNQTVARITTCGTLTLGTASMNYTANSASDNNNALVLGGNVAVNNSATFDFIDSGASAGNPAINLGNTNRTIDVGTGANLNIGWTIGSSTNSAGAITKTGAGTMVLNGANTYSGPTTINAGTLVLNGSNTNSAITINSGTLSGTGSGGATTVAAGGRISPGGNSVGTLAVSSLALDGTGGYVWQITDATGSAGTGWDLINVGAGSGAATINANSGSKFTIFVNGTPSNFTNTDSYTWNIIDWGTATGFNADAFAVNASGFTGADPSATWTLANSSGFLQLLYSIATGTPTYSAGTGTWSGNFAPALTNNSDAIFAGASGGTATNNIPAGTIGTLGTITFNSTAGAYTLAADSGSAGHSATPLTISGSIVNNSTSGQTINLALAFGATRVIDTATGNISIGGAISGAGGLTKNGTSTLVLSGSNSYTGATTINAGTLNAAHASALGSTPSVTVNNGGSLLVSADDAINNEAITLASSSTTVAGLVFSGTYANTAGQAGTLTLSQNSIIDLGTGSVTIHFSSITGLDTHTLAIYNWTGSSLWEGGTGNNTDQFYSNGAALTQSQLNRISFFSGGLGTNSFVGTGYQILGGEFANQVIPVPEPETYATGLLLASICGYVLLKRRKAAKALKNQLSEENSQPPIF